MGMSDAFDGAKSISLMITCTQIFSETLARAELAKGPVHLQTQSCTLWHVHCDPPYSRCDTLQIQGFHGDVFSMLRAREGCAWPM